MPEGSYKTIMSSLIFSLPNTKVRQIPLAVFAQDPPSYRTAAFGVTFANGKSGPEFVQDHRALGAPQILEIHSNYVFRWKVNARACPTSWIKPKLISFLRCSLCTGMIGHHDKFSRRSP